MPHRLPSALAVLALLTGSGAAHGQSAADPMADSLIGLWIDSVGGMETYRQFRGARYTINTILYDTLSGRVRRERPRYVWIRKGPHGEETRVERWEDYGFVVQGFDGRTTWAAIDGRPVADTARDRREALYVARDLFYWIGLPFKLRDRGVHLRYLGLRERPGGALSTDGTAGAPDPQRYHAVGVSFGEGVGEHQDVFTYYFAPGAAFPTEVTYVEEGREDLNRLSWGETLRVGVLRYPVVRRRDWMTASGRRTKALVISDVTINPGTPQAMFERP